MEAKDIEKEVQARVDFKMNELLTGVENTAKRNWHAAAQIGSQKYTHYWEAFNQLKGMIEKERDMGTPYDDMAEQNKRKKRDEAIEKISKRLFKRVDHNYQQEVSVLVRIIEDAQNW